MTAAVYRSAPGLSIPQTQNTAPVLEFNCLYTHDIRRKQKRWQDGFLRYHTFNRRAMVYDVPRNFIGDKHWAGDEALQEGDEMTLEKDGILVQVVESVGMTETDLTELKQSRRKVPKGTDSSPLRAATPVRIPAGPAVRLTPGNTARDLTEMKHRSLNALLGPPKGQIGKAALPAKSPFEQRHDNGENQRWASGRPPKRQRLDIQSSWDTTTSPPATNPAAKEAPLWARTADAAKRKNPILPHGVQKPGPKQITDLTADDTIEHEHSSEKYPLGFSSDEPCPQSSASALAGMAAGSSSPIFQTQRADSAVTSLTKDGRILSKPVGPQQHVEATSNGLQHHGPTKILSERTSPRTIAPQTSTTVEENGLGNRLAKDGIIQIHNHNNKRGQTLRIAASAPRKKLLLCQEQFLAKPSRRVSADTDVGDVLLDERSLQMSPNLKPTTQQQRLMARMAKIEAKVAVNDSERTKQKQKLEQKPAVKRKDILVAANGAGTGQQIGTGEAGSRPQTATEDDYIDELSKLDQMLAPPKSQTPEQVVPQLSSAVALPQAQQVEPGRHEKSRCPSLESQKAQANTRPTRAPGVPVQLTSKPSSNKRTLYQPMPQGQTLLESVPSPNEQAPSRPVQFEAKSKPRRLAHGRAQASKTKASSLNLQSDGTSTVLLSKPFQAPKPPRAEASKHESQDANRSGPWSREAFDLFDWRPPNWDEEKWCLKGVS